MSIENVKKLELGIDKMCNCEKYIFSDNITRKMMQPVIDEGSDLEEEAMQSGDIDVLERAIDYFFEESVDNGLGNGICESLESDIFQYFEWNQILLVLEEKLEKLIVFNIDRAKHFAGACFSQGYFEEFRNIFNKITSVDKKNLLLNECNRWIGKDYPKEIEALRKDIQYRDSQLEIQLTEE